jgi:hypothetical protein
VVAVAFSIVVPVLEAPDEPSHLAMARYLLVNHALPNQRPELGFPAGQEGSQPPLYYALGAVLLGVSPGPAVAPTFDANNPYVSFSRARDPRLSRNLYAHTPAEAWPFYGDVLGIHLVRLLSVLFGAATVLFTYLIAAELFPGRRTIAILAAALVAFNPQFVFINSVANNDSAIAATSTLVIWLLVCWLVRGGSLRLAVALGIGLGLALLAKTDGLLLLPLVGAVLLVDWVSERRAISRRAMGRRKPGSQGGEALAERSQDARLKPRLLGERRLTNGLLLRAVVVGGLALAIAGWWFARNVILYGEPLGWSEMLAANSQMLRHPPIGDLSALRLLWQARGTYWAAFGWTNILATDLVYHAIDVAVAVAGVGVIVGLGRAWGTGASPRWWCALLLLFAWPALVIGSLARWVALNAAADQGRLVFPAAGCIAVLLAFGIVELARAIVRPAIAPRRSTVARPRAWPLGVLAVGIAAGGFAADGWVLIDEIAPVYRPVALAAPSVAVPPRVRFGSDLELVDEKIVPRVDSGGGTVDVDLIWRAARPIQKNWNISLALLGDDAKPLAKVDGWPQNGRAPTSAWQVGQLYPDHYTLTLGAGGSDPRLAPLWLSVFDSTIIGAPGLPARDSQGQELGTGAAIGQVKLPARRDATVIPRTAVDVAYSGFGLIGYDAAIADGVLHLTLYWRDDKPVADTYTVFVHVLDRDGHVRAQQDGPPRSGQYPTNAWSPGDTIRDEHDVPLAGLGPATYDVVVGLYQASTGQRLPIAAAAGAAIVDNGAKLFGLSARPVGNQLQWDPS